MTTSDYFCYEETFNDLNFEDIGSGGDRWYLQTKSNLTWITVQDELTDADITKIKFCGNHAVFDDAVVGSSNKVNSDIRISQVSWLPPNSYNDWLYRKLTGIVNDVNNSFFEYDLEFIETLQFTKYVGTVDSYYGKHTDPRIGDVLEPKHRKLSFVVQLSDPKDYEGGDLVLHFGEPHIVPKRKGDIVFFPSHTLHEVTPVTKGTRYTLVGWVCGDKMK